ncbi:tripartite tricarboxylate transporter substrate-binding protein [Agrobacterium leguminum]|uniref:Bug family tripartite tricarboxylate transporter substrate binding protein n=1 Tax=Agrobacterium leguminum TaxID=2792015 RepID=UPI00272A08C7|nr:tripartite tricarboxylate transporter substrate-binding protein [Agrobacterium leguminum]WLE00069.1 tripartite tricarboxylate transporter substrate-binding protein [Agrobacterium leguminum]
MTFAFRAALGAALSFTAFSISSTIAHAEPKNPECIAPAQPGGGFDITCKLAQATLQQSGAVKSPIRVSYMPGGIGAVAYNAIVGQRRAEPNVIVAFSAGSLLNLAQGKFGAYSEKDVRWVASVGTDYGAVVVQESSEYKSLTDLMAAIKKDPKSVIIGAGGTIGSQDWMKAAMAARAAGIDYKAMRFVAFEGGGDCATALQGGHVHICMNDVGDSQAAIDGGAPLKLLAIFSEQRLPGKLSPVPTAIEQGFDIKWPIVRGFYVGPEVTEADYRWWADAFAKAMQSPDYAAELQKRNLFPLPMTGEETKTFVEKQVAGYKKLAADFGLATTK